VTDASLFDQASSSGTVQSHAIKLVLSIMKEHGRSDASAGKWLVLSDVRNREGKEAVDRMKGLSGYRTLKPGETNTMPINGKPYLHKVERRVSSSRMRHFFQEKSTHQLSPIEKIDAICIEAKQMLREGGVL